MVTNSGIHDPLWSFYPSAMNTLPVLLTIAGSDSGGGAGIQADLKTFQAFQAFGTTAITAITCQNTQGVGSIQPVKPDIVREQLERVLDDLPVQAAKTGMLFSEEIIRTVRAVREDRAEKLPFFVVDPVMAASGGECLLEPRAKQEMIAFLSCASIITPNLTEAEIILKRKIITIADMKEAAEELYTISKTIVLLKGGHRADLELPNVVIDVYYDGKNNDKRIMSYPRLSTKNTHGTGCTLSAAITACLAKGKGYWQAVMQAREYLQKALEYAPELGSGIGPLNHIWQQVIKRE